MKYAAMLGLLLMLALPAGDVFGQGAVPEQPDYIAIGNQAFEASDYDAAIAAYENVEEIELQSEVHNRLGTSYHLRDRLVEAETIYREVRNRDEALAASHNNLGAIAYARLDFRDAEDRFEDALSQDPENALLQDNLRAARHARRNNRSVSIVIDTDHVENPLLIDGREGDLIRVALLLSAEVIEDLRVEEIRGDSLMARKFFPEAIEVYEDALEIDRDNARLINKLGIAYHQNQEVRNAERQYRRALDANEYFLPALNNLGSIEMSRERYDIARQHFRRALIINPESPTVLQNLGYCLFALERYEDGLIFFISALRLDPTLFQNSGGGFGTMVRQPQESQSMVSFYLAKVFANVGNGDRTISLLYRAFEEGFRQSDLLEDSVFDFISGDERFVQLNVLLSD
jgi:tetratricopeptide (TPR) repeat protein